MNWVYANRLILRSTGVNTASGVITENLEFYVQILGDTYIIHNTSM